MPPVCYQCHFQAEEQSIPGDTRDCTCVCSHSCTVPRTSEKLPVPQSVSTVRSCMPNRKFIVATAALMTVTFCFKNSAISCFILHETLDVLQQQETLNFGYTNLASLVQFQRIRSSRSCRQGRTRELTLLYQFLPCMAWRRVLIIGASFLLSCT